MKTTARSSSRISPPERPPRAIPVEISWTAHDGADPLAHRDRQAETVTVRARIEFGDSVRDVRRHAVGPHRLHGFATQDAGFAKDATSEQHLRKAEIIESGRRQPAAAAFETQRLGAIRH